MKQWPDGKKKRVPINSRRYRCQRSIGLDSRTLPLTCVTLSTSTVPLEKRKTHPRGPQVLMAYNFISQAPSQALTCSLLSPPYTLPIQMGTLCKALNRPPAIPKPEQARPHHCQVGITPLLAPTAPFYTLTHLQKPSWHLHAEGPPPNPTVHQPLFLGFVN